MGGCVEITVVGGVVTWCARMQVATVHTTSRQFTAVATGIGGVSGGALQQLYDAPSPQQPKVPS